MLKHYFLNKTKASPPIFSTVSAIVYVDRKLIYSKKYFLCNQDMIIPQNVECYFTAKDLFTALVATTVKLPLT